MPLQRVRTVWTGFKGAPGYSNFYFAPGTPPPLAALRTFFEGVKLYLPTGLTIAYPASGDIINETTGTITDAWSTTPPANTVGTGGTTYIGPAGIQVQWTTSTVLDGRRPLGKTFLVPAPTAIVQTDGTVIDAIVAAVKAAADVFVGATASQFFVWHRPVRDPEPPHSITRLGGIAAVTGSRVPDIQVVLRSRRQ
jgi:hypothetical protein